MRNIYPILILLLGMAACGKGVTYEPGPKGPQGIQGSNGLTGATGPQGNTGPSGSEGQQGLPGVQGPTGPMGPQGIPGEAGTPGTSCSVVASNNGADIICTDGTSSMVYNGIDGSMGAAASPCTTTNIDNGILISCPDGSTSIVYNGTNSDINNVVPVEFCPSYGATSYPNNFPEYGFCIDDNIYAVYWTGNNAFMAQVVPGTYVSTSSTSSCTFVVQSHCNVEEQQ